MITESQIAEQMWLLLDGAIELDDFEDWIALNSWNMHIDSSEDAQRLAWAVELRLSEHSVGHLNDEELLRELRNILPRNPGVELRRTIDIGDKMFLDSGSSMFIEYFQTQWMEQDDTEFEVASS